MAWDGRNAKKEWQAGEHEFPALTTGTPVTEAVVFDVPFDQIPTITVTAHASVPDNVIANADNRTASGFDLVAVRRAGTSGNSAKVSWQAMAATQ